MKPGIGAGILTCLLKKTLVISCLLLLFMNQLGYYCLHIIKQHQLKEQVKQELLVSLPSQLLEKIDATANKELLQWEEQDKEFYLKGQLYDVARIEKQNDRVYLYCLNDKKEEQLLAEFSRQIRYGYDAAGNSTGKLFQIKLRLPDLVNIVNELPLKCVGAALHEYAIFNEDLVFSSKDVETPPPESIHS